MKQTINEIEINGTVYVPKSEVTNLAPILDGMHINPKSKKGTDGNKIKSNGK